MKKLLSVAAVAVALCSLMVSCASKEAVVESAVEEPAAIVHPRSYTFDMIDSGDSIQVPKNEYGPNYQYYGHLWKLAKKDRPLKNDTVIFHIKGVSDTDLPALQAEVVDSSATAGYWKILTSSADQSKVIAENIKAGEPFEAELTYILAEDSVAAFDLVIFYDEVVGKSAKITFERVVESTDTTKEVPEEEHVAHRDVAVEKVAAFFEIAPRHPWVNNAFDTSVTDGYQSAINLVPSIYTEDTLPKAGDTMTVTWKGVSDTDIKTLHMRVYDNSPMCNWWMELDANGGAGAVFLEDIKAGEPFEATMEITYEADAVGSPALLVWYDLEDATDSAIIKMVRNKK